MLGANPTVQYDADGTYGLSAHQRDLLFCAKGRQEGTKEKVRRYHMAIEGTNESIPLQSNVSFF